MINRIVLVGRLTRDPELRYTPNGVAVANITLAVNRIFKQDGQQEADFINIVVWKKQAENVANYLRKGSLAGVDGRLQTRSYENNEGKKVFVSEVVADSVQFLEPKGTKDSGETGRGEPPRTNTSSNTQNRNSGQNGANNNMSGPDPFASDGAPIDISDDDLPF